MFYDSTSMGRSYRLYEQIMKLWTSHVTKNILLGDRTICVVFYCRRKCCLNKVRFDWIVAPSSPPSLPPQVELDLKRLRDPLQLQLPVQQLTASKDWWEVWAHLSPLPSNPFPLPSDALLAPPSSSSHYAVPPTPPFPTEPFSLTLPVQEVPSSAQLREALYFSVSPPSVLFPPPQLVPTEKRRRPREQRELKRLSQQPQGKKSERCWWRSNNLALWTRLASSGGQTGTIPPSSWLQKKAEGGKSSLGVCVCVWVRLCECVCAKGQWGLWTALRSLYLETVHAHAAPLL